MGSLLPGDLITVDIFMRSDGEPIRGLQASAHAYDPTLVRFVDGVAVPDVFSTACLPGTSFCFGGHLNDAAAAPLVETDGRVVFVDALTSGPAVENLGNADFGVDGVIGGPQARLVFEWLGREGSTRLVIGPLLSAGEALVVDPADLGQTNDFWIELTVVPEPGTALLLGLGLVGLAAQRRR